MQLPHFTLLAATTRAGRLTNPLLSRFGYVAPPTTTTKKATRIVTFRIPAQHASRATGAFEIARRAWHPRIANNLLRRVRDLRTCGEGPSLGPRGLTSSAYSGCGWSRHLDRSIFRSFWTASTTAGGNRSHCRVHWTERETLKMDRTLSGAEGFVARTRSRGTSKAYEHVKLDPPSLSLLLRALIESSPTAPQSYKVTWPSLL